MVDDLALHRQVCFALYSASRETTAAYRGMLDNLGLTYPQYLVLLVLWEQDGRGVQEICTALNLDTGTVSPLLKRLEGAGLIHRVRLSTDERRVRIELTPAGVALKTQAAEIPAQLAQASGLSPDELTDLRDVLTRLSGALHTNRDRRQRIGATMSSVLIVITGANHWTLTDGTQHPTGFWAEELLTPVSTFRKAGVQLTFATPGGVRPTVDEGSLSPGTVGGEDEAARQRAQLDVLFAQELAAPLRLEDVKAADYDAVYVPGGHGPMEDLAVSPEMGELLVAMLDAGKIVSSVCHGPAALLSATRPDGEWAFAGRTLSGFINEEERQAGLADKAPWLLEDRLRAAGAELKVGDAWAPLSVVDGTIVTGQNPASSGEVAEKVVAQLTA